MKHTYRKGLMLLIIMTAALVLVACGGDSGGTTVRELEQTREAAATEAATSASDALATREAVMSSRAPQGTVFAESEPERGHDSNISIPFGSLPPNGGTHNPSWQKCGVYDEPVKIEHAVHSMEHGGVWVAYQQDLDANSVDALSDAARREPFVLVSPFPNLQSPVVVTAWGMQLEVDSATDPRIEEFIDAFANGVQTPEPGANCATGVTDTVDG